MYKVKNKEISRGELMFLFQRGGRTIEDVMWDKQGVPFILMFNPWLDNKEEVIYMGKPNLESIDSTMDWDFILGFKTLSEVRIEGGKNNLGKKYGK